MGGVAIGATTADGAATDVASADGASFMGTAIVAARAVFSSAFAPAEFVVEAAA